MFIKILYFIVIHTYYVGFINISNGIIGADAIGLPVLFTDCASHSIWWSIVIPQG